MFCSAVLSRMRMQKQCFTTYAPNFSCFIFHRESPHTEYNTEVLVIKYEKKYSATFKYFLNNLYYLYYSIYIKNKSPVSLWIWSFVYLFGFTRGQPKYDLRSLLRVPCLNLLIAFSLIWRTRSLVRPNLSPISSNVIS